MKPQTHIWGLLSRPPSGTARQGRAAAAAVPNVPRQRRAFPRSGRPGGRSYPLDSCRAGALRPRAACSCPTLSTGLWSRQVWTLVAEARVIHWTLVAVLIIRIQIGFQIGPATRVQVDGMPAMRQHPRMSDLHNLIL